MKRVRNWIVVGALLLVVLILVLWPTRPQARVAAPTLAKHSSAQPTGVHPAYVASPVAGPALDAGPDAQPRTLWQDRLADAEERLRRYLETTKYPPYSRPMREQPDQHVPLQHFHDERPLRTKNGTLHPDVRIVLDQTHRALAGAEAATLSVVCEKNQVKVPTTVLAARARGVLPFKPEVTAPVRFIDDGLAPDAKAGDFVLTAALQPATMGIASYHGRIGVELEVSCAGLESGASFQLGYSPNVPAVFTGSYREALEGGSLGLYVGVQVKEAGHFIITGRINDERGELAIVTFNGDLTLDQTEVKLTVFGKLLHDEKAVLPLRLRDLEGLRIFDGDPDRKTMKQADGIVYTTKTYPLTSFSDAEWSSEMKDRYVKKYSSDVEVAKAEVAKGL